MRRTVETLRLADRLNDIAGKAHVLGLAIAGLETDEGGTVENLAYELEGSIRAITHELHPPCRVS
jgi:hypothetical protein